MSIDAHAPDTTDPLDAVLACIGTCILKKNRGIQQAIKCLPDADVLTLVARLRDQSGCHGFRVEDFDIAADVLEAEVALWHRLEEARASGEAMYCYCCRGSCKSEAEHEANAARQVPPESPEVTAIYGMSRKQLIAALIEARGHTEGKP